MQNKGLENFFKGMLYTILAIVSYQITNIPIPYMVKNIDKLVVYHNLWDTIKISIVAFFIVYMIIGSLALTVKSLGHLVLCFYYFFFYSNKYEKIQIKLDEKERLIKESYLELKNGDIIPIEISKIILDTKNESKEEPKEQEQK